MEQIFKQITVNAPVEKVWAYLTESEKLEQWLMPNDLELRLNKKFTFKCQGHEDEAIECEILEIVPYEKLALSWYTETGSDTTVTISLKQSDDGIIITLIHSGWDKFDTNIKPIRDEYDGGWQSFFDENLKQILSN